MRSLETTTIAAIEVSKNNTAAQCVLQIYIIKAHKILLFLFKSSLELKVVMKCKNNAAIQCEQQIKEKEH